MITITFSVRVFFLRLVVLAASTAHSLPPPRPVLCPNDLSALRDIRGNLKDVPGAPVKFFYTWDFTSPDPCSTFSGVTCSPDPDSPSTTLKVSTLTLGTGRSDSPGLFGSLSDSIAELTELSQVVLFSGRVSGPIPSRIGSLRNLQILSLLNNALSGPIPDSISNLKNLHTLDLSYNKLSGVIPPNLMTLPLLKTLILSSNRLSGDLPSLPADLLHLDLRNNQITGTLNSPLSSSTTTMPLSLRYLSLSNNLMWGPLDDNLFQSLSELVYLDLSMNRFNGPLPPSIFTPTSLYLQRNAFTRNLPDNIPERAPGDAPGSVTDLSHNKLFGEIPGSLAGVETLYLNNNHFTGSVPESYMESMYNGNMKTLYLQHNYLSEFPVALGLSLPDSASLCVSYNCMLPLLSLTMACPASAGSQLFRPVAQCSVFNNSSTSH